MRVLLKWLADHVEIRETAAELADMLTMSGLEVEGVPDLAATTEVADASVVVDAGTDADEWVKWNRERDKQLK